MKLLKIMHIVFNLEQKFRVKHEMIVKQLQYWNWMANKFKLQIWDTAYQEAFKSINRRELFENFREWKRVLHPRNRTQLIVLVGNKVNLEKQCNIHNINCVRFPNLKDSKSRMKQIYSLLKQVQRIISNIIKTFSQAASQVLKVVQINQQEGELRGLQVGKLLTKHNFNNTVFLNIYVAEKYSNYISLLQTIIKIKNL
ncbi:unnamed protein product [Paramecium octaurelia]|uniref:Uncharacterized protein n=1 Tax=Paramecium octaurelia TaxID=43137 RepID=A0A8S1YKD2_PAROT|nr:unnamed protein product [Paramecium octaurelia]